MKSVMMTDDINWLMVAWVVVYCVLCEENSIIINASDTLVLIFVLMMILCVYWRGSRESIDYWSINLIERKQYIIWLWNYYIHVLYYYY